MVDRKIGFTYYALCLIIISYVLFYVLLYKQQYYKAERSLGGSVIMPQGTLIGRDNYN